MNDTRILALVLLVWFLQASWIFYDAMKRGDNKWLWGLFGLIHVPSSLIIYLIITRVVMKEKTCPHCLYNVRAKANYCSYCGEKLK